MRSRKRGSTADKRDNVSLTRRYRRISWGSTMRDKCLPMLVYYLPYSSLTYRVRYVRAHVTIRTPQIESQKITAANDSTGGSDGSDTILHMQDRYLDNTREMPFYKLLANRFHGGNRSSEETS